MSLINSMLRDLDARKSDGHGSGQFQQHVRAVPARRPTYGRRWIVLGSVAVVALAAAAVLLNSAGKTLLPVLVERPASAPPAIRPTTAAAPALPDALTHTVAHAPLQSAAVSGSPPVASVPLPIATTVLKKETGPGNLGGNNVLPNGARAVAEQPGAALSRSSLPLQASIKDSPTATLQQQRMSEPSPQERADEKYLHAVELLRQGKRSVAIQGLEDAVRISARHDVARQALIGALVDMGRKDDAIKYAQDGLAEHVAQPAMAMTLARLQIEKGELHLAISTLEHTLPYSAGRTDYEAFLAALLQRDEQHKRAIEHYLVALQKVPEAGVWWMGLGISYQALERPGEAQEAFKRAKSTGVLSPELSAFVETRMAQLER